MLKQKTGRAHIRILLKQTLFSQGYYEDDQATANAFAGDFYLTGDKGVQDEVGAEERDNCSKIFCSRMAISGSSPG